MFSSFWRKGNESQNSKRKEVDVDWCIINNKWKWKQNKKKKTEKKSRGQKKKEEGEGSLGSKKQQKPDNQRLALMILGDKSSRKRIIFFVLQTHLHKTKRSPCFVWFSRAKGASLPSTFSPCTHTLCTWFSFPPLFLSSSSPQKKKCFGFHFSFFWFVAF